MRGCGSVSTSLSTTGELVVQDVRRRMHAGRSRFVTRTRLFLIAADTPAVPSGAPHARAHEHDGVHERLLIKIVRRLAFVVARHVDASASRESAQPVDRVLDGAILPSRSRQARHERHVATQAQVAIRAQILQRLQGFLHVMGAHHTCAQLARECPLPTHRECEGPRFRRPG